MSQPKQPVNLQRRRLVLGTLAALGANTVHAATWQKLCAGSGGANTWRPVTAAAGSANTWRKLGACGGGAPISLTIAANAQNYNIFNAAKAANGNVTPPAGSAITVTINTGIVVGSSSTALYAMDTGTGWLVGTTIAIVNNGYIMGKGGNGGAAGAPFGGAGLTGAAGGPAINLQYPVSITNGAGYIYSGGGGGGGCGGGSTSVRVGGGGGAGNAAGLNAELAVAGGVTHGGRGGYAYGFTSVAPAGGALGVHGGNAPCSEVGGGGGGGGASGGYGGYGWYNNAGGGGGGGHGLAITQNGNAITWVSGNTRVYGGIA